MLISAQEGMEVVGEAADGKETIAKVKTLHPDVLLLDLTMPDLSGLSILEIVKRSAPKTRVLVLTVHDEERYLHQVLKAGASGYIVKKAADMELFSAIRAVQRGEVYVHSSLTKALMEGGHEGRKNQVAKESENGEGLSEREREVLRLLAHGYTNQETAQKLSLSVKTVETYKARLMEKLKVRTRAELVQYALKKRLLVLDE